MKKEELKVGDKVKAITNNYNITSKKNEWEGIVTKVKGNHFGARTTYTKNGYFIGDEFELRCGDFSKVDIKRQDLQFADVLTLRNGERYVVADNCIYGEERSYSRDCDIIQTWYNADLTQNEGDENEDIVKVERAGQVIYERKNEVKEMTVEEISKALGYEVKIAKEKSHE